MTGNSDRKMELRILEIGYLRIQSNLLRELWQVVENVLATIPL